MGVKGSKYYEDIQGSYWHPTCYWKAKTRFSKVENSLTGILSSIPEGERCQGCKKPFRRPKC
jgi:hypothetical protein